MKKALTVIGVGILVAACNPAKPIDTEKTDNVEISVGLLFEHDGCKMYRFKDNGNFVYYSSCNRPIVSFRKQTCGKNCIRDVQTQTIPVGR